MSAHVFFLFCYFVCFTPRLWLAKGLFDGSCNLEFPGTSYWTTDYASELDIDDMDCSVNCTIAIGHTLFYITSWEAKYHKIFGDDLLLYSLSNKATLIMITTGPRYIWSDSFVLCARSPCANSVSLLLRTLRLAGFCRMKDTQGMSRTRRILLRGYHLFVLFVSSTHVLLLGLHALQMRNDLDKLPQILYVTLCFGTCLSKHIVFHLKADEIDDLITRLDDPLMNQEEGAGSELMQATTRDCARLYCFYTGCAVTTCVLWNVNSWIDWIQGRHVEFFFWIGFNYDHFAVLSALMLFTLYLTNTGGIGQTAIDTFIVTILEQCKTQLHILRLNFESLPVRAASASKETGKPYATALQRLLVDSLLHYKKITELCTLMNDIFTVPLLVQFGIGGWILCMAAVELVDLKLLSIECATTSLFISCILMELFLFCYFGSRVAAESDRVSESIYGMICSRAPISFHRSLLVLMERAKRPLRPAAGLVMPLSLETYLKILKSAYSFYAVLRQTKEARS